MKWTAPCGHPNGVPVIGAFVLCSVPQCDGLPGERCHKCPSKRIAPFSGPFVPPEATHCLDCGAVRFKGYQMQFPAFASSIILTLLRFSLDWETGLP